MRSWGAAQNISAWMALAQAHRGVVLADRLPKIGALFEAGLISEMLVRAIEYRTALVTDEAAIARVDALLAEQVMAWVMDTYSMHVGHTSTAVVTGKPIEMGGSLGRREATGRGVMIVTREAAKHLGFDIKGARVAVQGFGNVGSVSADLLSKIGAKIVAVTDWKGGVYNENGLDIEKMLDYAKQHKTIDEYYQHLGSKVPVHSLLEEVAETHEEFLRRLREVSHELLGMLYYRVRGWYK